MLPGPHRLDDFFLMHIRRRADVNDVNLRIIEKIVKIFRSLLKAIPVNCHIDLLGSPGHYCLKTTRNIGSLIPEIMKLQCASRANYANRYNVFHFTYPVIYLLVR